MGLDDYFMQNCKFSTKLMFLNIFMEQIFYKIEISFLIEKNKLINQNKVT